MHSNGFQLYDFLENKFGNKFCVPWTHRASITMKNFVHSHEVVCTQNIAKSIKMKTIKF